MNRMTIPLVMFPPLICSIPLSAGKITNTCSINCNVIVWEPPANTGGEITGYTVRVYYKVNGRRTSASTTLYSISDSEIQWLSLSNLPSQRPLYFQVGQSSVEIPTNVITIYVSIRFEQAIQLEHPHGVMNVY